MEDNNTYPGQTNDEITQRVIYKHVMAIAPILFGMALLMIVVLIAAILINSNQKALGNAIPAVVVSAIGFAFLAIIILITIATFWIWRSNKVVITNKHIVDVDQIGLFNRNISTLRLEEIQDVSSRVNGPLETMFQYGTLIIQTAGERENFVFDFVPNPNELENYIIELRAKYYGNRG